MMIAKNVITHLGSTLLLALIMLSCTEKKVAITKDYVINPNWDKTDNSFQISKMNFKKSGDTINLKKVVQSELLEKLVEDTSFSFIANIKYNGEKYSKRKVYFNKDNGFIWWSDDCKSNKRILGELKQDTWYLLAGLSKKRTLYYIYIDSLDNIHCFKIMASNW